MKNIFFILILCSVFTLSAESFILKDGSVIVGELVSYSDSTYTVNTKNLGQIQIKKEDVVQMNSGNNNAANSLNGNVDLSGAMSQLQGLMKNMNLQNSGSAANGNVDIGAAMSQLQGLMKNMNTSGNSGTDINQTMQQLSQMMSGMTSQGGNTGNVDMSSLFGSGAGDLFSTEDQNSNASSAIDMSALSSLGGDQAQISNIVKIVSSPAFMRQILSIADNPSVQALITDPQIVQAMRHKKFQLLMSNKKFLELMNDPEIKKIIDNIKASLGR